MSLPRYREYKDSGVPWIGDVPAHWRISPLKRQARLLTEKADSRRMPIALENIEGWSGRFIETEGDFLGDGVAFSANDILFGKLRPYLAKVFLAAQEGEAVGDFHVLRPDAGLIPRYAQYQMLQRQFIDVIDGSTFGSKMPRASWESLGGMPFVVPQVEEQGAIAAFLDRETAKIDALIAEQETLLALLAEKRQATISHAVTRGLDPGVPMKDSGIAWLGEVPAHWAVTPFRYCVKFQEGPGIMADDFLDDGVPLLRVSGVHGNWATLDGCNYLNPTRVAQKWNHFRVELGDLLISASASLGTVCEVGPEVEGSIPYTGIIRLKGIPGAMTKDYIRHFVVSGQFLRQIDLFKAGATIQHFGPTHLSQMIIAQPPLDEQAEIASYLDEAASRCDMLTTQASSAIELLKERRSALIAAAVTGKIDVRHAA